jgi:hypothetical protein
MIEYTVQVSADGGKEWYLNNKLMPARLDLGQHMASCIGQPIFEWEGGKYLTGGRHVMGYNLPAWQRPFVWTRAQSVRLIESIWLGLNIGTYTFNRSHENPAFDNLLIDGQQRLVSIQAYLSDGFAVFGHRWSELPRAEQREFEGRHFHCFITKSTDEEYLRGYYDMMNFGGVAHKESERATLNDKESSDG